MSRTRYKVEKLRNWEDKVEDLRHEEEQHRLAEVSENSNDGERHSGKVAKRVADKHSRRIPDSSQTRSVYSQEALETEGVWVSSVYSK